MTLEFEKLASAVEDMVQQTSQRREQRKEQLQEAQARLTLHASSWNLINDVVETAVPADFMMPTSVTTRESGELDFTTFEEVWSFIEEEFDGELPEEKKRLYAAISGSLETLDDEYTRFIRPDVAERMREDMNGSVSGIGAFVRENDDGFIEIIRPIDGQPADLAGLLPGDVIISVDGETVADRDFNEVLLMVRGPEGTPVTLTIMRQDETELMEFTIIRALFEVPVVEQEMLKMLS